jgi:putative sigma-54 modulation protein
MDIRITCRHSKSSPELQQNITDELNKLERFYDRITSCHVILDTEASNTVVEIVMNGRGHSFSAKGKGTVVSIAIADAVSKIGRQLKKLNEKVKDHHGAKKIDE